MKKGEIVVVGLDPTVGSEMNKTRPCVVVSPDEMNDALRTVNVVPITSKHRELPTRVLIKATRQSGLEVDSYAALDQIKTVDKMRVLRSRGFVSESELMAICDTLKDMFEY